MTDPLPLREAPCPHIWSPPPPPPFCIACGAPRAEIPSQHGYWLRPGERRNFRWQMVWESGGTAGPPPATDSLLIHTPMFEAIPPEADGTVTITEVTISVPSRRPTPDLVVFRFLEAVVVQHDDPPAWLVARGSLDPLGAWLVDLVWADRRRVTLPCEAERRAS